MATMKTGLMAALASGAVIGCAATAPGTAPLAAAPANPDPAIIMDPAEIDPDYPQALRETAIDSHGHRMNGLVYLAGGQGPHPTVVLLHGYPGNEKNLDLAQTLRRDGFNVLFFHYRGSWGSEGKFSFANVIDDVGAATAFIRSAPDDFRMDPKKVILMGHSMGGFAALQAASRDAGIRCVAGLAAADFGGFARAFRTAPAGGDGFAAYTDTLVKGPLDGFSGAEALAELSENEADFDLVDLAPNLAGKRVLLIAANGDTAVDPDLFHEPMAAAYGGQPEIDLTSVRLEGDHSFSWTRVALQETVLAWLDGCR